MTVTHSTEAAELAESFRKVVKDGIKAAKIAGESNFNLSQIALAKVDAAIVEDEAFRLLDDGFEVYWGADAEGFFSLQVCW